MRACIALAACVCMCVRARVNATMMAPSAPPSAPPEEDEPRLHLIVSAFFLSMVAAGVLLALLCHCYGGAFNSTIGMATLESAPEEGPDHPEEDVAGAPKAAEPVKVERVSEVEL